MGGEGYRGGCHTCQCGPRGELLQSDKGHLGEDGYPLAGGLVLYLASHARRADEDGDGRA